MMIELVNIIMTGLARKGRNSLTKVVGMSLGTEAVFLAAWRIPNISTSVGIQLTSETKSAPGGTRSRSEESTGVKSLLIFAK